jgi:hypothetical protein
MRQEAAKQGSGNDAFSNLRLSETLQVTPIPRGVFVRMLDCVSHISSIVSSDTKNESAAESLLELANHAILLAAVLQEEKQGVLKNRSVVALASEKGK